MIVVSIAVKMMPIIVAPAPVPSAQHAQEQRKDHRAGQPADKYPSLEVCIQDDFATARLLGRVGLFRRRLRRTFSDHVRSSLVASCEVRIWERERGFGGSFGRAAASDDINRR
jgi:hypothetical protein